MQIRPACPSDGPQITAIQGEGLSTGHASFRADPVTWQSFDAAHAIVLVAVEDEILLGWTALLPTSTRDCYAGVGEVSTYVSAQVNGRGVGRALLNRLVSDSERQGWWSLVAQIFPENGASLSLHLSCGFRLVGTRTQLGLMTHGPLAGVWRDVQMLERRSSVSGR